MKHDKSNRNKLTYFCVLNIRFCCVFQVLPYWRLTNYMNLNLLEGYSGSAGQEMLNF